MRRRRLPTAVDVAADGGGAVPAAFANAGGTDACCCCCCGCCFCCSLCCWPHTQLADNPELGNVGSGGGFLRGSERGRGWQTCCTSRCWDGLRRVVIINNRESCLWRGLKGTQHPQGAATTPNIKGKLKKCSPRKGAFRTNTERNIQCKAKKYSIHSIHTRTGPEPPPRFLRHSRRSHQDRSHLRIRVREVLLGTVGPTVYSPGACLWLPSRPQLPAQTTALSGTRKRRRSATAAAATSVAGASEAPGSEWNCRHLRPHRPSTRLRRRRGALG